MNTVKIWLRWSDQSENDVQEMDVPIGNSISWLQQNLPPIVMKHRTLKDVSGIQMGDKKLSNMTVIDSQYKGQILLISTSLNEEKLISVVYRNEPQKISVRKETNLDQIIRKVFSLDETSKIVLRKSDVIIDACFENVEDNQIYNLQVTLPSTNSVLALATILKDFQFTLPTFEPISTWLPRHIRSKTSSILFDDKLSEFENYNRINCKSTDKHDHYFMYCINGSGYGKTWSGHYVPLYLSKKYPSSPVAYCFLDFSVLSEWEKNSIFETHHPEIVLGLLVAARMIYKCTLRDLLLKVPESHYAAFEFKHVMGWISNAVKRPSDKPNLPFVLHFDEIHTLSKKDDDLKSQSNKVQPLLHVIGNYMCSTTIDINSSATLNNILMYPVITGTSSKGFKQEVTNYGSTPIELEPFNYTESLHFLENHGINFSKWKQQSNFKRLVKCCGGLPRCLKQLVDVFSKRDTNQPLPTNETYFDTLVKNLLGIYKFQEQLPKFGGEENLKVVIALAVNAVRVQMEMILYDKITIEDIMKEGVIFLRSSKQGGYKVVLPMVYIHCLNICFHLFPIRFDDVFKKAWDWYDFENWDCQYQLIKNNTCLWLSNLSKDMKTTLGTLFNCQNKYQEKQIQLTEIRSIAKEKKQFLPKALISTLPQLKIETNIGELLEKDFKYYSFHCLTGNPSVDARIIYDAASSDPIQKPWMVCRQFKHSIKANTKLNLNEIALYYSKWQQRMSGYFEKYRCFYVLITNKVVDDDTFQEVISKMPEMSVVYCHEFGKYCPLSFSLYSIFDDDTEQVKEEMHASLTTPKK